MEILLSFPFLPFIFLLGTQNTQQQSHELNHKNEAEFLLQMLSLQLEEQEQPTASHVASLGQGW